LGEVLSDCGISAVGIVDADALPTSERPSPAAPSTFTAAALVVRFCVEVFFTRGMVASSIILLKVLDVANVRSANPARKGYLGDKMRNTSSSSHSSS
jgi:hypothetical protein